jgi:hypothetical protein
MVVYAQVFHGMARTTIGYPTVQGKFALRSPPLNPGLGSCGASGNSICSTNPHATVAFVGGLVLPSPVPTNRRFAKESHAHEDFY